MKAYQVLIVTICASVILAEHLQETVLRNAQLLDERIVGGSDAQRRQFPYQVSLQEQRRGHVCGGSILTQEWVLTAGHCILVPKTELRIFAGLLHQKENHADVQFSEISDIKIHPRFPGGAVVAPFDIALLRLSRPLKFTQAVQPISLPRENEEFSGMALISGWGQTSHSNANLPTTLQQTQLQILTYNQCAEILNQLMGSTGVLDNAMICVRDPYGQGKGACPGDSGGPMMQNGKLLGIASWVTTPCGRGPSVYTKVSKFIGFIRQYVRNV